MKDFDIAKYLKEHQLGSYGILNHYVDMKPLKEEGVTEDVTPEEIAEIPYEGPEHKLTGLGDSDEFEQAPVVSEAKGSVEWQDLDHTDLAGSGLEIEIDDFINRIEKTIQFELTNDETVSQLNPENPRQTAAQIRLLIKKLWMEKIQGWGSKRNMEEEWYPHLTADPDQIIDTAIKDLKKAGLSIPQIKQGVDRALAKHSDGDEMPLE